MAPELLTPALKKFHKDREERDLRKDLYKQKNTKKSKDTKSTDKANDASRKKRQEQMYWSQMTKILSDQKLSVWRALDKSLAEYYQLLVDRQNLIEETGLLNQQNEELKTLLNQYLQAGVNQELQVPPTQVIRLDIWAAPASQPALFKLGLSMHTFEIITFEPKLPQCNFQYRKYTFKFKVI